MRILFENLIIADDVDLTSLTVSDNYPLSNLKNRVLTRRTQSLSGTLSFTVTFPSPTTINCICFGYTNGDSITVKGITQDIDYRSDMIYFPEETLTTFDVEITGTEDIYLGGLAAGLYYQMPDPLTGIGVGIQDGNSITDNRYGINYKSLGAIVDLPTFIFRNIDIVVKKEIEDRYDGVGSVCWLDSFENNRILEPPKYVAINQQINFTFLGRNLYNIDMFFKETN